jgi:Cdc6-like AAA superfamily ATPase
MTSHTGRRRTSVAGVGWSSVPRRGVAKPGRGWVGAWPAVPAWRMTSDQAPVLWPFLAAPPLPAGGALLGWDLGSGGLFHADPVGWVLDPQVPVANPNVFVFGKPGRGKSATVKRWCCGSSTAATRP